MESPIQSYLEQLLADVSGETMGTPYPIHPSGSAPDPQDFGICLATVDGYVYSVGASDKRFSIQSISKPFSYGLAMADHGIEAVDEKVDVEPSGDPFNEISLAPGTGRPANAMINAGALAVVSMIKGSGGKTAPRRIMDFYSKCAGRRLAGSKAVFDVEMRNSDRNHSLAYLLSSFGVIDDDPTRALENYLRQCSAQVTCRDLAMMAGTLANAGTNPRTGETALEIEQVERVLSVMMTSGMYDDAGSWVSSVGMPAKSGVGGGTLAVLPGQAGLAVFSPPLDAHGSSVRGVETCRRLSSDMEMHFVRAATGGNSTVKTGVGITQLPSRIRRTEEQAEVIERFNGRCRIIEVTGDLAFAGTESLVRAVSDLDEEVTLVVLDMQQVNEVSSLAVQMLDDLERRLAANSRQMILIEGKGLLDDTRLSADPGVPIFLSRGGAVEYCENRLLVALGADIGEPDRVVVPDSPALSPLDEWQRTRLVGYMEPRNHEDGDIIRRVGQRFGGVHFIVSGQVNTIASDPQGDRVRLNTLSAGMTFGELALGSDDRQETTEKAVGSVELMVLTPEAIEDLEAADPQLALLLWRALTRDAYLLVDRYLRETAVRLIY
ncbi:glutaminase A [Brevibacterium marinum]|uniref:Glutaminase n=1 Tax=Brevibacterium marinum TaxID=418643 RepID=A0A846S704_9MICO|nr:glutaminase A [Brevibacterium marinum]NJC58738.1 glutaminase [Brevibacterium marinum]